MSELKTNLEQILQEKTTKLIPENIKRKVEIFDVTGTDGDAEVEELQAKIIETRQEIADTRRDLENSAATVTGTGENVTLNQTAEATLKKLGIGGNSEQESTTGKNKLILRTLTEQTVNGITFTPVFDENNNTLKYINVNGTATASANIQLSGSITLNGTFTLSSGLGISTTTYIRCLDSSTYAGLLRTDISGSQTANLENRTVLTYLYVENGTTVKNVKIYPMIEQGSTATSYEPYTGGTASPNPDYPQEITNVTGDVEVVVENKNLFDLTAQNFKDGTTLGAGKKVEITLKPNTSYTLSSNEPDGTSVETNIWFNGTSSAYNGVGINRPKTTQTDANGKLFISIRAVKIDTIFENCWIQLEEGSTATEYVEHKGQTFTIPLGNEKLMLGDYLADDGIHHVRKQIVLDGSENINWKINSFATHYNFYAQVVSNCKARQLITCSHSSSNSFDDTPNNCYISAAKNFNFNFSIDGVTTSNAFNNWLSTHNTVIEYELEEEIIVPYTSAQQTAYNQIKQAISYEEQTNISSSDTISPIFTVTAFRDADLAIASLDNRVTLLED